MSSNPTQPKFGDQGEGVNFPPEDDAEGHAIRFGEGGPDGGPEGARIVMTDGGEDDTEGHRLTAFAEGQPDDGPEGHKLVPLDSEDDDTEGHRIASSADGGQQDGPDGFYARL